jgi:hypothetical protein
MRFGIFLLLCYFSTLCIAQDSIFKDANTTIDTITKKDSLATAAIHFAPAETLAVNKKKKTKKKARKEKEIIVPPSASLPVSAPGNDKEGGGILFLLLLLLSIGLFPHFKKLLTAKTAHPEKDASNDDFFSDHILRKTLPRREYYLQIYLKSDAWKRKRALVLKRDNHQCVYCGGKATQVHHKRYAKINIGKEPIEWLVSICHPCHENLHNS